MGRRYLFRDEVHSALSRGKAVECFLGGCERDGRAGIRYLTMTLDGDMYVACLYESADFGSADFLDVYSFGRLDPDREQGDPDGKSCFATLDECLAFIGEQWPGSDSRLTNEGVVQAEYADYLATKSVPL